MWIWVHVFAQRSGRNTAGPGLRKSHESFSMQADKKEKTRHNHFIKTAQPYKPKVNMPKRLWWIKASAYLEAMLKVRSVSFLTPHCSFHFTSLLSSSLPPSRTKREAKKRLWTLTTQRRGVSPTLLMSSWSGLCWWKGRKCHSSSGSMEKKTWQRHWWPANSAGLWAMRPRRAM